MYSTYENLLERSANAESIVIVGAGSRGKDLLYRLSRASIPVKVFFDNNLKSVKDSINNIKVVKPYKMEGNNVYIIAVDSVEYREAFRSQLLFMGISENDILSYDRYWNYDYLIGIDENDYKKEVNKMYYEVFGRNMKWENPITYNEKINCEKLSIYNRNRANLVDKLQAKKWVEEQLGSKYVTKLYAVWDDANKIDFDLLPSAFVLKMNNASARNIIVADKTKINQDVVRMTLNEWKKYNYSYNSFELQYKDIVPKIFCEEYLEGVAENVYDYNIFCFHGEPEYIWCIKGSHRPGCKASFYDKNWEIQPFSYGYPKDNDIAPKPEKLNEMLELSRILSKNYEHVRVDWYNLPDGRVLFGEITFTTWSGMARFIPDKYDIIWGNMI